MRTLGYLLFSGVLLAGTGCGGDENETTAEREPVSVWRADSPRVAAAADTSAVASAPEAESSDTPVPAEAGADAAGDGAGDGAAAPSPAAPAATSAPTRPPNQPATARTAEEILLRAERAYESVRTLRADFVQDLTVPLLASTQRSSGEIFHRKPNHFLMRFTDPDGDMVVADGRYLWAYYPSSDPGQVMRTSAGQAGQLDLQREFLSNPTERFDAALEGSATAAGRAAKVLTLVPRQPAGYTRVRIWIDDEDALARRFEITETNENVRRVELQNLQTNVTLADDLFTFVPPEGAEVFEQ